MTKRIAWIGALATLTVTLAAHAGDIPPLKLQPVKPGLSITPTVRVTGFRRSSVSGPGQLVTPVPATYSGGGFFIAVDVENTGTKHADDIVVRLAFGGKALSTKVSIPAKSSRPAFFGDPEGVASTCKAKAYTIDLTGQGASTDTRNARATPSCTFTSKVDEEWNHATPDHVEYAQKGKVFLTGATLITPPTCSDGPKIKVRLYSQYTGSSPSLVVQAKTPGGVVKAQTAAAFPLGPKEYKELVLTPVANANDDVAPKLALNINDWTKSLGAMIADGNITVETTRTCTLGFALID